MDPKLKGRVEKVLERIGMDVPTAVRVYFAKIAETESIPFSLGILEDKYSPEQLAKIDRLAEEAITDKNIRGPFSSAKELIKDLNR